MRDLFIDISRVEVLVDMVKAASTDINQLIELQTEIGAYGYYLAEHCADVAFRLYMCKRGMPERLMLGEVL